MTNALSSARAAKRAGVLSLGLLAFVGAGQTPAETGESSAETYEWFAELVSFDEARSTATVRARIVAPREQVETDGLSEGAAAMLTWSGLETGSGVRALEPGSEPRFDRMTMPVEFVAVEGSDLVFSVQVPTEDASSVAALEPGRWVTATTPRQPTGFEEAVLSIGPYADVE